MRPGSGASEGSGLTLDATSASGSTPGLDVSLGSRLISGSAFAAIACGGGARITRADPCLPCSQMLPPPHSLHLHCSLPCSQMPGPPHSLHILRFLPCSQIPFPGHSLQ